MKYMLSILKSLVAEPTKPTFELTIKDLIKIFLLCFLLMVLVVRLSRFIEMGDYLRLFVFFLLFFPFIHIYLRSKKCSWQSLGFTKREIVLSISCGVGLGSVLFLISLLFFLPKLPSELMLNNSESLGFIIFQCFLYYTSVIL